MRLIANLDSSRHGHIFGHIHCKQFTHPKPIHFIVDTGCSTTTLLSSDVTRLGINCSVLTNTTHPCTTANGNVLPYCLPDAKLFLEVENGWLTHKKEIASFSLQMIYCMPPNPNPLTPIQSMQAYSLLGMNFLYFFKKWKYNDTELILET
ncbi:MAG: hypothetical protein IAX21_01380 [Candidatus Bathyarchaeota archaeon]|nr:MAG: hypothetical protein NUK63_04415 [Candidatus Bathyarchaeum tardum]WNZ29552.1 MAG: hypothetical protein IAX21_01380 [Candidatus Bathyarchaeota archaeon]